MPTTTPLETIAPAALPPCSGDIEAPSPFVIFERWFQHAALSQHINDPRAANLATVSNEGQPSSRTITVSENYDESFIFYTHVDSQKSRDLGANPKTALCYHWEPIEKQIRIAGIVTAFTAEEADTFFAALPRQTQMNAWTSDQAKQLDPEISLEQSIIHRNGRFPNGKIPRPYFWSGFRLKANYIEFWESGNFRIHRRTGYQRTSANTWSAL